MNSTPRTVVVGAGVGGLVSAALLAAAGHEVWVLERAARPGGKLREVSVDGHAMDAGPTVFTMRWVFEELFAELGERLEDRLPMRRAEVLARHAWDAGARLDLPAGPRHLVPRPAAAPVVCALRHLLRLLPVPLPGHADAGGARRARGRLVRRGRAAAPRGGAGRAGRAPGGTAALRRARRAGADARRPRLGRALHGAPDRHAVAHRRRRARCPRSPGTCTTRRAASRCTTTASSSARATATSSRRWTTAACRPTRPSTSARRTGWTARAATPPATTRPRSG
ncbi:NAD(P)-binding protein [Piscinibacter sakaiensis]|uniref:NAD(P)-binding protein n=1 Tax=Piscinibacter sakaiensis TaxID=1547922 RepID=UPI003728B934